jgi:hypothetical protein
MPIFQTDQKKESLTRAHATAITPTAAQQLYFRKMATRHAISKLPSTEKIRLGGCAVKNSVKNGYLHTYAIQVF